MRAMSLLLLLVLACAVGQASAQDADKPRESAPSFLYFTREAKVSRIHNARVELSRSVPLASGMASNCGR